eukprot:COSAG01_NODE_14_length_41020_cov_40.702133_2_plen_227_part_00
MITPRLIIQMTFHLLFHVMFKLRNFDHALAYYFIDASSYSSKLISELSYLYLSRAIAYHLDVDISEIKFERNKYGKPFIKNNLIYFNLSHCAKHIAFCLSFMGPVGIDIENISRSIDFLKLAKRYFHTSEFTYLSSLPSIEDLHREFYLIWTQKEAYVKAIGRGISYGLNNFTVQRLNTSFRIAYPNDFTREVEFKLFFKRFNLFHYSIAYPSAIKNLCFMPNHVL